MIFLARLNCRSLTCAWLQPSGCLLFLHLVAPPGRLLAWLRCNKAALGIEVPNCFPPIQAAGPESAIDSHQLTSTRSSDHSTPLYRKLLTHPTIWICGFIYFCISFELPFIHFCQFPSLSDNFHSFHRFLFHSIVPFTIPPHHSTSPLLSNW